MGQWEVGKLHVPLTWLLFRSVHHISSCNGHPLGLQMILVSAFHWAETSHPRSHAPCMIDEAFGAMDR